MLDLEIFSHDVFNFFCLYKNGIRAGVRKGILDFEIVLRVSAPSQLATENRIPYSGKSEVYPCRGEQKKGVVSSIFCYNVDI